MPYLPLGAPYRVSPGSNPGRAILETGWQREGGARPAGAKLSILVTLSETPSPPKSVRGSVLQSPAGATPSRVLIILPSPRLGVGLCWKAEASEARLFGSPRNQDREGRCSVRTAGSSAPKFATRSSWEPGIPNSHRLTKSLMGGGGVGQR